MSAVGNVKRPTALTSHVDESHRMRAPTLELRGIEKRFGGEHALRHVSLVIASGVTHAIVGENGAGKSTAGKIASGVVQPDAGVILLDGLEVRFASPSDALAHGVAIMEQELALAPDLTVRENVLLGAKGPPSILPTRNRAEKERFRQLLDDTGFELDGEARVGDLPIQEQQLVELLRALAMDARIIIMDEPTAALPAHEVKRLHAVVRKLNARGVTVILISHFLDEVLDLCDSVSVLRGGSLVATYNCDAVTQADLIGDMLGKQIDSLYPRMPSHRDVDEEALEVRGVRDGRVLAGVDLTVRVGEILGIYGLVGSGRSELLRAISGDRAAHFNVLKVGGRAVRPKSPAHALTLGIALLPESRKDDGLFVELSQRHNVLAAVFSRAATLFGINPRRESRDARSALTMVGVDPVRLGGSVVDLSGGNQQKVLLGKVLQSGPTLLLLDEPTRGVDLGARRSIYETIFAAVSAGASAIVVSSDLDEILNVSHRIAVLRKGRLVGEMSRAAATSEAILRLAFGAEDRPL